MISGKFLPIDMLRAAATLSRASSSLPAFHCTKASANQKNTPVSTARSPLLFRVIASASAHELHCFVQLIAPLVYGGQRLQHTRELRGIRAEHLALELRAPRSEAFSASARLPTLHQFVAQRARVSGNNPGASAERCTRRFAAPADEIARRSSDRPSTASGCRGPRRSRPLRCPEARAARCRSASASRSKPLRFVDAGRVRIEQPAEPHHHGSHLRFAFSIYLRRLISNACPVVALGRPRCLPFAGHPPGSSGLVTTSGVGPFAACLRICAAIVRAVEWRAADHPGAGRHSRCCRASAREPRVAGSDRPEFSPRFFQ